MKAKVTRSTAPTTSGTDSILRETAVVGRSIYGPMFRMNDDLRHGIDLDLVRHCFGQIVVRKTSTYTALVPYVFLVVDG